MAGRVLLKAKMRNQLAYRQHRTGGRPRGHHLLDEPAQRMALHFTVLEVAERTART